MVRTNFTVAGMAGLLLCACAIPRTVDRLEGTSPPPEFGRPGWVRTMAGTGAWVGAIVGGVASIVLLPVTWPISKLADDGLGEAAAEEFLLFPAVGGAAIGHFAFGAAPDVIDHVFRRAWLSDPPPADSYELIPIGPPPEPLEWLQPATPRATDPMPVEPPDRAAGDRDQ